MIHPTLYNWFEKRNWQPFDFQRKCWEAVANGASGLLNAPTGFGKTYALYLPLLNRMLLQPEQYESKGLRLLWITPLRALTADISRAMQEAAQEMGLELRIESRTGDTDASTRNKQRNNLPEVLLTTPESLHLLLSRADWPELTSRLEMVVADEWHEMLGNKRGVMLELAMAILSQQHQNIQRWGISATIGNLSEAMEVLLGSHARHGLLIQSEEIKKLEIHTIIPAEMDRYPWAGHLGLQMVPQIIPLLQQAKTTLIFTNTRSQTELWYQRILEHSPELAGLIAVHHGSLSHEIRDWVEQRLHEGKLLAVVCTSSLDLGVDFRPVEQVIQIGSPKGVSRFLQRAGRSGHQPGATSRIWFVPTHALELMEAAAMRTALEAGHFEHRQPIIQPIDLLLQFLMTLACGCGMEPNNTFEAVKQTFAFQSLERNQFDWCIKFLLHGGESLEAYDEYQKAGFIEGKLLAINKRIAMKHRMSIGTIVGDSNLVIEFMNGSRIGTIEEYFISSLNVGDVFWFSGRALEFVRIRDTKVQVRKAQSSSGKVPSWQGGRMPLSSQLSANMRARCDAAAQGLLEGTEMEALKDLLARQMELSHLPAEDELLIEYISTREGYHLYVYPFEGRQVHEGLAVLLAYRISRNQPMSFSIAMNDYGFELLSDQAFPASAFNPELLFETNDLRRDIFRSLNATEMARRQFGEICRVAGLVFHGYPGTPVRTKHIKASSHLLFDVFHEYEPHNLLVQQAFEQVLQQQLDEGRMRMALLRMQKQRIIVKSHHRPTPFCFPIMADRLREKMSNESLADRLKKMLTEAGE
jgi:ATP-dependent Lhr-like helicase